MQSKIYPDEDAAGPLPVRSISWTYKADGQPATRTSPRTIAGGGALVTTWTYYDFGQLTSTSYNDGTPTASWTYNPHHGRAATLTDAAGTHTYTWRANGLRESESLAWTGGGSTLIDPSYDSKLRRDTFSASIGSQITPVSDWNYSATTGRLAETVAGARKTVYGYHTGIDRISTRQHYNTTTMVTQTVESLDTKNRIQSVMNSRSAGGYVVLAQSYYSFDALDRRQTAGREDSTLWEYAYNDRGEVTGGVKKPDPVWLQYFEYAGLSSTYAYDSIGNRTLWTNGGGYADSGPGASTVARTTTYTPNELNLYTAVTQSTPRSSEVIGRKTTSQSVQINGTSPYEQTVYGISNTQQFRGVVSDSATSGPGIYKSVTVTRNGTTEYSGVKWLPPVAAVPTYDNEGNLLTDGRWTYTWDAENRLIMMVSPGQQTPAVDQMLLEFTYDAFSRRVSKKVSTRPWTSDNSGTWVEASHERFVYDGWNLAGRWKWIAATSTWTLQQTYIWGPDVSGSYQGAGGVGGLNMILSASGNSWFPCYDGNGNITALVNAVAGGAIDATYDYDAFGQPVRQSGVAALLNPFRFSTKYTDDESELVYYGYRYYDPVNGRWLGRDPIGERGGNLLVGFLNNSPSLDVDVSGMFGFSTPGGITPLTPSALSTNKPVNSDDVKQDIVNEAQKSAPWMKDVAGEIGVKEDPDKNKCCPSIEKYANSLPSKNDQKEAKKDEVNAWCGCFAAWILTNHKYKLPSKPRVAKSYANDTTFIKRCWCEISEPRFGAMVVFTVVGSDGRPTWQGHVGFAAGQSLDDLIVVGGNQGDMVQPSRYSKSGVTGSPGDGVRVIRYLYPCDRLKEQKPLIDYSNKDVSGVDKKGVTR